MYHFHLHLGQPLCSIHLLLSLYSVTYVTMFHVKRVLLQNKCFQSIQVRSIVTIIMGPPGGGKGTISEKMMHDFKIEHISSGDMLRSHVKRGSTLGVQARSYMNEGHLVPDKLIIDMIIEDLGHHKGNILLDGFPRTLVQAKALDEVLKVNLAVYLKVPFDDIIERTSDRWVHLDSGRVYSYGFNPPKVRGKDDETGEPLVRRADDEPDKVRERLEEYASVTMPLVHYYEAQGVLSTFDGSNNPDLVAQNRRSDAIYAALKPILLHRLV